ncbi:GNAT family N-acetyltransferase [Alkalicoccobacillus plakortidis]|uniref:GNAT family N-acetyltransferase n=1 Tax=Alkalicoccobacillus plakortidis TaxID=444060 RepID=A0ABT0XLU2_9BACI|nr:GNAT family N-acetyltransferase [Alkalicoccobacillus plakortidis]MCM2676792.1 GNAT family N-acetyltransferase [Alkalicoccobacillus plakortidis]
MLTYEIIEYKEDLAAAVAKMWNESREGWGGDQEVETEEERRTAEATNGNILTLLAFDGDSVIGYCGFSEYKGDEGALYIPLLNVHPDHHGKGIGKKLVLEALKRTTELGWPRLDLYTWPGNTKAVPLYKRCGFFWEERDDRVHLLNFIPKLITHPVLSHYIDSSNWYETLKREIEIKPDGEKNNGFTYYTYQFDTENGEVQAKIEQSGRGISGFSTERYEVDFTLPTHKLLLSGNYEGTLHIQTKQQGSIRVKGTIVDHPYIESTFIINEKVKGTKTFTIPFSIVKAPELEQSKWKTHPKLTLELEIDGEEVVLELGTAIKKPVKLEPFLLQKKQLHSGERAEYYVRVENQLEERQIVQIKVNGIDQPFVLELKSLEKQVLTIPFTVLNTGEMKVDVSITSTLEWLDSSYKEQLSMAIPARNKSFVMESATHLLLYHGENVMKWSKEDHQAVLENALTSERIPLVFLHPIIGKPSSHYLAKKTWDSYTWERHIEGVTLKLNYQLEKPHCRITRVITWSNDGQLTAALNVTNTGESALTKLDTGQLFYLNEEKVIFPIEGTILEADESVGLELLPLNQLSEPWLFIEGDSHTFGVQWPKNANLYTPSLQAVLEQQAEEVEPGVTHEFEPLKIDIDVYANWQVFQQDLKQQPTRKLIDLSFSKHHGFFTPGHEIEIELSHHQSR